MTVNNTGMTLIEVVVAILILAVGVLGAFALQSAALKGTVTASEAQALANIAHSELQIQSEFLRFTGSVVAGESCRTGIPSGFSCTVVAYPCRGDGTNIMCVNTNVTQVVGHQVVVVVTGPSGRDLRIASIVKSS